MDMKLWAAAAIAVLGMGCVTRDPKVVKTQVVTYPDGAIVHYNGNYLGRAPAEVVLPQDAQGRLTQQAVIEALPNTKQEQLFAQRRVFAPEDRSERVPNRVMIDLRFFDPDAPAMPPTSAASPVESPVERHLPRKVPYSPRGKPTQAVGINRWDPGVY